MVYLWYGRTPYVDFAIRITHYVAIFNRFDKSYEEAARDLGLHRGRFYVMLLFQLLVKSGGGRVIWHVVHLPVHYYPWVLKIHFR